MKEGNDKLTISVDEKIKSAYKKVCDEEGLKIGKQIELFMLEELKRRGIKK
jgi:antitoxin component of RelBE/YafQ-DinJ toxin-antitoxin module